MIDGAKRAISSLLWTTLGRRNYARLGRFLFLQSRLDVVNDMAKNGERALQRGFAAAAGRGTQSLVIADVGANVGHWSAGMLDALGDAGIAPGRIQLHAFEPAPQARAALEGRLAPRSHRAAAVHVRNLAVSDTVGRAELSIIGESCARSTLAPLAGSAAREVIAVERTTMDAYAASEGLARIDFLKIDTEGNDFFVLRGARELLEAGRIGMAQLEYNHLWVSTRSYLKDVFDLVRPLGYSVGKVTPLGVERYGAWHPELESFREGNYLVWRDPLPGEIATLPWWMDNP